jgi:hypothetical protein
LISDFGFSKRWEEIAGRKLRNRMNDAGVRGVDCNGRKYED